MALETQVKVGQRKFGVNQDGLPKTKILTKYLAVFSNFHKYYLQQELREYPANETHDSS